jgi:hypothetical protein
MVPESAGAGRKTEVVITRFLIRSLKSKRESSGSNSIQSLLADEDFSERAFRLGRPVYV